MRGEVLKGGLVGCGWFGYGGEYFCKFRILFGKVVVFFLGCVCREGL